MYGNFVHATNDASHYTKPPTGIIAPPAIYTYSRVSHHTRRPWGLTMAETRGPE